MIKTVFFGQISSMAFFCPAFVLAQSLGLEETIEGSLGDPRESGFYQSGNAEAIGDVPDQSSRWTHLINARHGNTMNHHALQIAASYSLNDRLFFRKIEGDLETINPPWHEIATRGPNRFSGQQIFSSSGPIGEPVLKVQGTWAAYSSEAEDNRPFTISRHGGSREQLDTYVQDAAVYFNYKNDESYSSMVFRIRNLDTESGGGADASDRNVLKLHSNKFRSMALFQGNVGVDTTNPVHKLNVNGTIRATEVIVETGWTDFVFEEDYNLRTLSEVESHIQAHGHLPDIPSAAAIQENGLKLAEAQTLMMQKIEELTLYAIEQEKEKEDLEALVRELSTTVESLRREVQPLQ